jgi:hypothetical protein
MKTNFLLPNYFKRIGWLIFFPGVVLGIFYFLRNPESTFLNMKVFSLMNQPLFGETAYFSLTRTDLHDEIAALLIIIGALFIAFSKQKSEDEFISKIRLESLLWATYMNYFVLIFAIIFIYDLIFYKVMIFNMFTILVLFIIRFNIVLYYSKRQLAHEE